LPPASVGPASRSARTPTGSSIGEPDVVCTISPTSSMSRDRRQPCCGSHTFGRAIFALRVCAPRSVGIRTSS
jgi:hypothetical protein